MDHRLQIWSTVDQKRDRAPPGARRSLRALQKLSEEPDDYIKLMRNQSHFEADDVLSPVPTADTFVTAAGEVDVDIAAFKKFERAAWDAEMKVMAPMIVQQAKTEPRPKVKLGTDAGRAKKESRAKKRDSWQ